MTTFDGGATIFDGGTTSFDADVSYRHFPLVGIDVNFPLSNTARQYPLEGLSE